MGKYHPGDLCKIVSTYDFTGLSYPNPSPMDDWQLGLIVRIVGNYNEVCGDKALYYNTHDYKVVVPPEYNPQCYNDKSEWEFNNCWCSTHLFGWSWVQEAQLEKITLDKST